MDVKISSSDDEMNKSKEKSESSEISENSKNSKDNEQIINYFPLINKNLSNLEENRQNYFNKLSDLKSKFEEIKSKDVIPKDFILLVLSDIILLCDTYYSSFAEQKKILENFNKLNELTQKLNYCFEKEKFSRFYIQEANKKISKQYEKLFQENQNLKQKIKDLKEYYEQNKKEDLIEINNQKEIKDKMDKVMEENFELKKKYSQALSESKIFKDYADEKYIKEQENKKRMSKLLDKIDMYEDKIGKMQNKIKQYENEKEINEKKELEISNINKRYENEENDKSEFSEEISNKQGLNLEELLQNQNELEENDNKQKNDNNSEKSYSIKRCNDYDIDNENYNDSEQKPSLLMLCPINKNKKKSKNNIHIYKSPFSCISSSISQSPMTQKNKKIKKRRNFDKYGSDTNIFSTNYNKIFFILLLKSIIINKNLKHIFKKSDFEMLFKECEHELIPYNKYENWLINKFKLYEDDEAIKQYENSIVNDCFICSSII